MSAALVLAPATGVEVSCDMGESPLQFVAAELSPPEKPGHLYDEAARANTTSATQAKRYGRAPTFLDLFSPRGSSVSSAG
jgi:hypothetical protein